MAIDELSGKTDKNAMDITYNGKASIKVEYCYLWLYAGTHIQKTSCN